MKKNTSLFFVFLFMALFCYNCCPTKLLCDPPTLTLNTALPINDSNQEINYSWNQVNNATQYALEVTLNGTIIDQVLLPASVTQYSYKPPTLKRGDQIVTSIFSVCENKKELAQILVEEAPVVCNAPTELNLVRLSPGEDSQYKLTYGWPSAPTAESYNFEFFVNDELTFEANTADTSISFTQQINPNANISAQVRSNCGSIISSDFAKSQCQIIITDDLVFRSESDTLDICNLQFNRRYEYIEISGKTIIINGIDFTISSPHVYYPIELIDCLCPRDGINQQDPGVTEKVKNCFIEHAPPCIILLSPKQMIIPDPDIFLFNRRNFSQK